MIPTCLHVAKIRVALKVDSIQARDVDDATVRHPGEQISSEVENDEAREVGDGADGNLSEKVAL